MSFRADCSREGILSFTVASAARRPAFLRSLAVAMWRTR